MMYGYYKYAPSARIYTTMTPLDTNIIYRLVTERDPVNIQGQRLYNTNV